jgi:hypothetical protein
MPGGHPNSLPPPAGQDVHEGVAGKRRYNPQQVQGQFTPSYSRTASMAALAEGEIDHDAGPSPGAVTGTRMAKSPSLAVRFGTRRLG